jgi:hypothetical protein
MRYQILLFTAILSFSVVFAGCSGEPAANKANNTTNINAGTNTVAPDNSNNSITTTKKTEVATTNNAPTIAPVIAAYYEALKKKDDAALRKVVSQATLKQWEADMKEDKKTSLVAFLLEIEPIPDKPVEVRNEKIEGDSAVAEIRGGSYAVWTPFKFVRENGEWKRTNESPDFESVKKSATESNTAK